MTRWKRRSALPALLGLAWMALVAVPALPAQEGGAQPEPRELTVQERQRLEQLERRFIERVSEALELTEEQANELRETLRRSRAERADVLRSRLSLRRELNRAIGEANPDQARIQRLLDERSALDRRQAQVAEEEERRLGEFLTPVQKARLIYLRQRMAQALRDRIRQVDQQRPQQRPRRPAGTDRPRTDQVRDGGPRLDSRSAIPRRPADGAVRSAP